MHHTKIPFLSSSKANKKMWIMEFTYVKKTDLMYRYKDNVTVSETDACKISTYSRIIKYFMSKKRMGTPHFLFSNNIAHPSSNSPRINITANILLRL